MWTCDASRRKVDRRHSLAVVVLATVALLPGCGNAGAPSLSTTAPTSPGITAVDEFRVSGAVTDTAYRPLCGVRVEVADGPKAGTVARRRSDPRRVWNNTAVLRFVRVLSRRSSLHPRPVSMSGERACSMRVRRSHPDAGPAQSDRVLSCNNVRHALQTAVRHERRPSHDPEEMTDLVIHFVRAGNGLQDLFA